MIQRKYTKTQLIVIDIINEFANSQMFININKLKETTKRIKKKYHILDPYLTLREYIEIYQNGSYNTFHFMIGDKDISIDTISDMLTDDLCCLYPLTNNYYVVEDHLKSNNGDCTNYHCDHYLSLSYKED